MTAKTDNLSGLTLGWLMLVALTFVSLELGTWTAGASWLPLLMAVVIWVKCSIIADRFIEANHAHPFVRRVVQVFIGVAPIALVLIGLFGSKIRAWTTL